jgi:hypothetical protein
LLKLIHIRLFARPLFQTLLNLTDIRPLSWSLATQIRTIVAWALSARELAIPLAGLKDLLAAPPPIVKLAIARPDVCIRKLVLHGVVVIADAASVMGIVLPV